MGAGPAGAAIATLLARSGREVMVLERSPQAAWRACGVFSSPAGVSALRRLGLDEPAVGRLSRPMPALRVETLQRTAFRLTYGDDGWLRTSAVGFDRPALDVALVEMAASAGASVRRGAAVRALELPASPGQPATLTIRSADGDERLEASVVVGADGLRSIVARRAGVVRPAPLGQRVGLTYHLPDPGGIAPRDGRMVVLDGAYCGIAPVPGGRLNIGIVLASSARRAQLATDGAVALAAGIVRSIAPSEDDDAEWRLGRPCDEIAGASPLGQRVSRRAGEGWLLIGDAAGFLDPFTGEGLHRALVSAELAALAVDELLHGDRRALQRYERAMARSFGTKDIVSRVVQTFVARPAMFEYTARRLAGRARVRETMGLVMGDLVPAGRALDPRFLVALLAP
ncbi:MAG: NAD(P)/FAD-dependent oxidoreductase [Chloroflexota bacterium]|nr:NAD(P)/FAD-dependent oxidoreductase [Chloroflexota bacterium]